MCALQLPMNVIPFHTSVLAVCAASFALTALLARYAQPLCARLRLIDLPDARKLHTTATPLLGGLALLFAILPLGLLASALVWPASEMRSIVLMVLAIVAITAIGIADDRESLAPRWRVLLGFAVFGGLAAIDPSFLIRALRFPLLGLQFVAPRFDRADAIGGDGGHAHLPPRPNAATFVMPAEAGIFVGQLLRSPTGRSQPSLG